MNAITQYLTSNDPPSDENCPVIRQSLVELEGEMAKTAAEIERLQALHESQSQAAANLRMVLSPLRRLPSEILAEIFTLCLLSQFPNEPQADSDSDDWWPTPVAAICEVSRRCCFEKCIGARKISEHFR